MCCPGSDSSVGILTRGGVGEEFQSNACIQCVYTMCVYNVCIQHMYNMYVYNAYIQCMYACIQCIYIYIYIKRKGGH